MHGEMNTSGFSKNTLFYKTFEDKETDQRIKSFTIPEFSLGLKSEPPLLADWKLEKSAKDSWAPDGSPRSNRFAEFEVVEVFCSDIDR